ncbi:unnamed protein product [Rotaria socialis]|uniref:Uncharacterized protein n=1 Tax=Rotaria socialis TaxID=392032 RepID=A0A820ULV0_9BILA|nr:unnamed protein product [Rotaria socialis]CAF3550413.1 unnamed protein product [Rotaria socialis]CAF4486144.1 unnamed protein product [Rotaria socialis]CAF4511255.1 unnamed protein product [Rotaria socialis]
MTHTTLNTVLEMNPVSQPAVTNTTSSQQGTHPHIDTVSHQSARNAAALLQTTSGNSNRFLDNLNQLQTTPRQRADIQLKSYLDEPEELFPRLKNPNSTRSVREKLSIAQVSKLLKTQEFLIRRLARILYPTAENLQDIETLTKIEAQKLTRILNGTIEVRALVFFMILDEAGDDYVIRTGMAEFYVQYFKGLANY